MVVQDMFATPMAGEISPNVMFGEPKHEGVQMYVDVCVWVCVGVVGCGGTGGHKNKSKRGTNR